MYEVDTKKIIGELDPRELIWMIMAHLDMQAGDTIQEACFGAKATGNTSLSPEQIESALELFVNQGLIKRLSDETVVLQKDLHIVADYIDDNPPPNIEVH